jgi:RNA polymerase sigma factor (sigma-70 family)
MGLNFMIPDSKLLPLLAKADSAAFEQLYKSHYYMVQNLVLKNSGSADDASDLFQEVLIILYEKARDQKLVLTSSLKTYIYSIARNQWLKKLQSGMKNTRLENFEEFISVETEPEETLAPVLNKLLDEIGEACRKLLVAFYYRKKNMDEICIELNYMNADSAKNQKYKCIQRLKKMVGESK